MSSLRNFAAVVVTLVLCRLAIGELRFLWPPGLGAVPSLHVSHLSLVRSVFFLSPRSWRCFPCLGWVCFWSSCGSSPSGSRCGLRLGLVRTGYPTFSRVGAAPSPGFLFFALVVGDPSTLFILLCLPSGCGHPFESLVFFVTIDRQRRFPLEGFFFWVVASHFGVVS